MVPNKRPFTKDLYDRLLAYFRQHPGDSVGAAKSCGCGYKAAQKTWAGPLRVLYPWATPAREVFAQEEGERLRVAAEQEAATRARQEVLRADAEKAAQEAKQWDETILRLARNDVMKGLGGLARMVGGLDKMAMRVNEQLERGTDSAGNPIDIPIGMVLQCYQRFATATRSLTDAANALVAIERVKANLPTAITQLDVNLMSLDDIEREVELAQTSLGRAKALGLTVVPGGKDSR